MKIKKAQKGAGIPKGYVKGEMTGRLIPEKEFYARRDSASKDLQKAVDPKAKVAPKKKMQAGGKADTLKASVATFKNRIGDTAAVKKKADSLGLSSDKVKSALKARIAAKQGGMKKGGKLAKQAAIAISMKKKGMKPKKSK